MHTARRIILATLIASVALGSVPATASTQRAEVVTVSDGQTSGINPCTGNDVVVTLHDVTATLREAVDRSGNLHLVAIHRGNVTTTDGFTGRFTETFVVNDFRPGRFDDFVRTSTVNLSAHDAGQTLSFHGLVHVRVRDGELHSDVTIQDGRCTADPVVRPRTHSFRVQVTA